MSTHRVCLQGFDEKFRATFSTAAQDRGWSTVENLPADAVVMAAPAGGLSQAIATLRDRAGGSCTPVIAVGTPDRPLSGTEAANAGAQAYVPRPDVPEVLAAVSMVLDTIHRYAAVQPLTGLPGGPAIQREIERRFHDRGRLGVVLLDIDNFKPFNDLYGYRRGDRFILWLKEIIGEAVARAECKDAFVGHLGGDDFVLLASPEDAEAIARDVIQAFDVGRDQFFDESDRRRGFFEALSRTGEKQRFPLSTLTAVMVTNEADDIQHPGQMSRILAELKAYAKTMEGSNFFRDRRQHHHPYESLARERESH
ncbi:MAG: GGDEF domain-containing protein [Armatimonadota bacterium]